ncbi:MAG: SiaB family protein kinase [Bacteroidales bacterium]|nr:SiaB family protein kinase [Bacteroidales bacterium]
MKEKKFDIDEHFVEGIEIIYENLISKGISIVYIGKFNHSVIKMFSSMAEDDMRKRKIDLTTRKRVYHAIIEILQNMARHSDEITEKGKVGRGLFMIGKKRDKYFIITSNKIKNSQIEKVEASLQTINNATLDELNEMHQHQLKYGTISKKGGAGLGLIDIARKTSKNILYNFISINKQYSYFLMKVVIDKRKIN